MTEHLADLRFWTRTHLGWPGILGALLIVLALITGIIFPRFIKSDISQNVDKLTLVNRQIAKNSQLNKLFSEDPVSAKALVSSFPLFSSNVADLDRLFDLAKTTGISLTKVDYQLNNDPGLGVMQLKVTVPVKQNYRSVRRFIAGALNELPHLAVDELQFARAGSGVESLDSQIKLTLFYRAP
jgi:hypothetical protein